MYTQESSAGVVVAKGTGVLAAETVSAAVAVHGEFIVLRRCKIKKIIFYIETAIAASVTAPVVTFRRRPTPGSSSGQSTLGTLTLPDLTGIGKVLYKDITPVSLGVGDSICLDHTTQAVDGSAAAGGGYYGFELELDPETPANESDMILSA